MPTVYPAYELSRSRGPLQRLDDEPSAKDFGAVGDNVADDTIPLQAWLDAVAGGIGFLPLGSYRITAPLRIRANTTIRGAGRGSRLVIDAAASPLSCAWAGGNQWYLIINASAQADTTGDDNIRISGIHFDMTAKSTVGHAVHLHKCANPQVTGCFFTTGNDGVALTASTGFLVEGNYATGQTNCAYDCWEGSADGVIASNIAEAQAAYGILVTGNTTLETTAVTRRVKVIGNVVKAAGGNLSVGIWFQGGINNVGNGVEHGSAVGNHVDGFKVGIRMTGAKWCAVDGNTIYNTQDAGLHFSFEVAGNETHHCSASGNTLISTALNGASYPIQFQNNVTSCAVVGGAVDTHGATHAVGFFAGTQDNQVIGTLLKAGGTGVYLDTTGLNLVATAISAVLASSAKYIGIESGAGARLRTGYAAVVPAAGTWLAGDRVYNRAPAVGQPKSWVCTVGGTPGTWVSEGNL